MVKVNRGVGDPVFFGPCQVGRGNRNGIPILELESAFPVLVYFQDGLCSVCIDSLLPGSSVSRSV